MEFENIPDSSKKTTAVTLIELSNMNKIYPFKMFHTNFCEEIMNILDTNLIQLESVLFFYDNQVKH